MKRKTRTAAQKAASRRNLVKARAAKARQAKTTLTLYHNTRARNAKSILAQGFKGDNTGKVWFTNRKNSLASNFVVSGRRATLSVRMPRTKLKNDVIMPIKGGERWFTANVKDLQGRKIRQVR